MKIETGLKKKNFIETTPSSPLEIPGPLTPSPPPPGISSPFRWGVWIFPELHNIILFIGLSFSLLLYHFIDIHNTGMPSMLASATKTLLPVSKFL